MARKVSPELKAAREAFAQENDVRRARLDEMRQMEGYPWASRPNPVLSEEFDRLYAEEAECLRKHNLCWSRKVHNWVFRHPSDQMRYRQSPLRAEDFVNIKYSHQLAMKLNPYIELEMITDPYMGSVTFVVNRDREPIFASPNLEAAVDRFNEEN